MPPKPPPKQITSLRQIDISKMDVKDLQNIDYQKILKDVRQRPDTAIAFAAPVIALFICFNMFTKFQAEQKKLSASITQMNEKVELVEEYNNAQTEFDSFTKALPPKITENEFINTITDLAVKNNIQIESYTPGQGRMDTIHEAVSINLVANAIDFLDLGRFVSDLEKSGLAIRINSWGGMMGPRSPVAANRQPAAGNPNGYIVNFRMDISSVTFKL